MSNNKILKYGTEFLYQVFPSDMSFYHSFLIRACNENDLGAVKRLVSFFSVFQPSFINLKEPGSLNSALHIAAYQGFFVNILDFTLI